MARDDVSFDWDFKGETLRAETLPAAVSISMASVLLCLSRVTVSRMMQAEELRTTWLGRGYDVPGIPLDEIAAVRGEPITLAIYREAQQQLGEINRSRRERRDQALRARHGAAA